MSVFLVLPADRLSTYSRWLRLFVTQSLLDMAGDPERPEWPVLYLLDEFASLDHLAPVERAMGLMAGFGVQLWPILQDVHQLRATYGRRPEPRALDSEKSGISYSQQHTGRPLLTPDEVRNLPQQAELLFLTGNGRSSPESSPITPIRNSRERLIRHE